MSEETVNAELSPEEAYQQMVQQIYDNIDMRDFMTPTQREIAYLSIEELEAEYKLVEAKQSTRSRMQRDLIQSRWEYEQMQLNQSADDND